jgi:hypothetical protein
MIPVKALKKGLQAFSEDVLPFEKGELRTPIKSPAMQKTHGTPFFRGRISSSKAYRALTVSNDYFFIIC